jgi:tRNA(Arg) A34 adenosine deaminase TadA/predicted ester cyclase
MSEDNKAVIRRLVAEVLNAGRLEVIDELYTPELASAARRWIAPFRASFPDAHMEIVELVAEGDKVVGRFTCSATHLGEWLGHAPTGRRFQRVDEVAIFRLRDGRIAEAWSLEDSLSRLQQLGLLHGSAQRRRSFINDDDLAHLRRCVQLATEALEAGDEPFGSVLVAADGTVLAEDRNRVAGGDQTRHPEFELARWAAANLDPAERAAATVYTSGEHCPMCAAAHGWVGLGRIVYVASSEQLAAWLAELEVPPPPVRTLPIQEVVPSLPVEGPVPDLAEAVHDLIRRFHGPS